MKIILVLKWVFTIRVRMVKPSTLRRQIWALMAGYKIAKLNSWEEGQMKLWYKWLLKQPPPRRRSSKKDHLWACCRQEGKYMITMKSWSFFFVVVSFDSRNAAFQLNIIKSSVKLFLPNQKLRHMEIYPQMSTKTGTDPLKDLLSLDH